MCTFSSPAKEITALGSVAWETTVLNQGSKAGRLKYYSRKSSPRIIVTMDIVSILAYFAIFVAHISAGEGQGWTVVCGSWMIGSQLDKFLREWERKREVTGPLENGKKCLSYS